MSQRPHHQRGYGGGWQGSGYGGQPAGDPVTLGPKGAGGSRAGRLWLGLGCGTVAVLLVAVLATGYAVLRSTGGSAGKSPRPVVTGSDSGHARPSKAGVPRASTGRALPRFEGKQSPVTGRVKDGRVGLSYPRLGGQWGPIDGVWLNDFSAGLDFVSETTATGTPLYANIMSTSLPTRAIGACGGRGSLPAVASAATRTFTDRYFRPVDGRRAVASQRLTIDGRRAYLVGVELRFDQPPYPGVTYTKNTIVVVTVDTGRRYPAVMYLSLPDTHYQLRPDFTTTLEGLMVLPGGQETTPSPAGSPRGKPCIGPEPSADHPQL